MTNSFPRTLVGGVSLSRMIIGTNWLAGYSHSTLSADKMILDRHNSCESVEPILETFVSAGIDTIMGLFSTAPQIYKAIRNAQEKTGSKIILIDTPTLNVDDTAAARREAERTIRKSKELGATFCLIHHSSVEQLVDKNRREIKRLDDYTKMIRDAGLIPGLSAHMPELVVYSDLNGYDVETYIQIYNCLGFLMQVEVETVASIIHSAKKPVMTIKPMAAGRCTPFVGLNFSWATIRDCDMVTVGCFNEMEAAEDIEISMAALEHRHPTVGIRHSPNEKQASFGK
ncbi:MAG: hypothetical protein ACYCYI_12325 [Saccharofermentanales bacterium]